jgi:hypothetical protein
VAVSFVEFAAELRRFDDRRVVVRELGKDVRTLLPPVRKAVRARALEILPKTGGLGAWVAESRVTLAIRISGRQVGVVIKAGRDSIKGRSDMDAVDRGRVRHPTWGHRGKGQWQTQSVTPGWFTDPAGEYERIRAVCDHAVDVAFDEIRRG